MRIEANDHRLLILAACLEIKPNIAVREMNPANARAGVLRRCSA
jgi:hypothetical protein